MFSKWVQVAMLEEGAGKRKVLAPRWLNLCSMLARARFCPFLYVLAFGKRVRQGCRVPSNRTAECQFARAQSLKQR